MKKVLIFCFLTLFVKSEAQNLVPNPSFEDTIQCPNSLSQLNRTQNWFNPTTASPDYYNSCDDGMMNVPNATWGFQYARTGNAYAGCHNGGPNLSPTTGREYIEVQLIDSMISGRSYCISFYVSLANVCSMAISNIGCYLSLNSITSTNQFYFAVTPQIENPVGNYLTDTMNWMKISGTFIASGGEKYITIGNFHDDATNDSITIDSRQNDFYYYFIDDVSVMEIVLCSAGNNITMCENDSTTLGLPPIYDVTYSWQPTNGLNNPSISNPKASPTGTTSYTLTQTQCDVVSVDSVLVAVKKDCNLSANGFIPTILFGDQFLYVHGMESFTQVEVYDIGGRRVFESDDYVNDFGGYSVSAGVYLVRVVKPDGTELSQKIFVIK